MDRQGLFKYAAMHLKTVPDYPWKKFPNHAILRHAQNRKWYGLVMEVAADRLGLKAAQRLDILNVKVHPEASYFLQQKSGIFPAYHMNREHWISILLDSDLSNKEIFSLLNHSFDLTK